MATEKVVVGESGEVIIPPRIRSALHLKVGTELEVESTAAGVLLRPSTVKRGVRLEDLRGFLKTDGPAVPIEDLCKPVDYSRDWEEPEARDK
jgi:AbrB family looped-hinge helix DNA binding protein